MEHFTSRLILREMRMDDLHAIHAYASDIDNVLYMTWGPNTLEETERFLKETLQKESQSPRTSYDFAIVLKSDGRMIGGIGLYLNETLDEGMMGWIIHRNYWNQGYVTESARHVLSYAFDSLGLRRVTATCDAENIGSFRIMEKIGMRKEAHFVQSRIFRKDMGYRDELHYAILASEYRHPFK